jgi:hypothetical protein
MSSAFFGLYSLFIILIFGSVSALGDLTTSYIHEGFTEVSLDNTEDPGQQIREVIGTEIGNGLEDGITVSPQSKVTEINGALSRLQYPPDSGFSPVTTPEKLVGRSRLFRKVEEQDKDPLLALKEIARKPGWVPNYVNGSIGVRKETRLGPDTMRIEFLFFTKHKETLIYHLLGISSEELFNVLYDRLVDPATRRFLNNSFSKINIGSNQP